MESSTLTLWTGPFPVKGVAGWFLLLPWFTEILVLKANSVDPDQTPQNTASDQGLHCLPMSLLWDDRLKWVKEESIPSGYTTLKQRRIDVVLTFMCLLGSCEPSQQAQNV